MYRSRLFTQYRISADGEVRFESGVFRDAVATRDPPAHVRVNGNRSGLNLLVRFPHSILNLEHTVEKPICDHPSEFPAAIAPKTGSSHDACAKVSGDDADSGLY
jgi:hypothetical protein